MSNEVIAVSIPQMEDDIDIYEEIKVLLKSRKFVYIDMKPEFLTENIVYRFQRNEDKAT